MDEQQKKGTECAAMFHHRWQSLRGEVNVYGKNNKEIQMLMHTGIIE